MQHRTSRDLDYFCLDATVVDVLERSVRLLALDRGWEIREVQRFPGFRRFIVRDIDGDDETIIDIVHDPVPQLVALGEKPLVDGVRVDSLRDLVANKLCALLGRGDVKDLVDLYFLDEAGVDIIDALDSAWQKDGGMEPAMLAYIVQGMRLSLDDLHLVKTLSSIELTKFRDDLVRRLVERSWPT